MPYYDASSCWHCGTVFDKPGLALRLDECPQTHYRKLAFCGFECALGWMTEAYASSRREKQRRAQYKSYPEVVLKDGKLAVIPPSSIIRYNNHVGLLVIHSRSGTQSSDGERQSGGAQARGAPPADRHPARRLAEAAP